MKWLERIFSIMPLGVETSSSPSTETSETPVTGKAPRKALAPKSGRVQKGPARPYKKQDSEVLQARINTMTRKIELLKSKTVILQDRLELHEAELTYRQPENTE